MTRLRTDLLPAAMASIPSAEHAVGGITADNVDYTNQQVRRMPWVAFPAFPTCGAGGDNALGTALADRAR